MGLTRPYANLRAIAKRRAEAMQNNMLIGLAVIEALLAGGLGLQVAVTKASKIGGPFCNLLSLLSAELAAKPGRVSEAIEIVRAHMPDVGNVEMNLFLRDVEDHLDHARAILPSVEALRISAQRLVLESTEKRAAVVLQRTSILGIFAVVGLILAIMIPFLNM